MEVRDAVRRFVADVFADQRPAPDVMRVMAAGFRAIRDAPDQWLAVEVVFGLRGQRGRPKGGARPAFSPPAVPRVIGRKMLPGELMRLFLEAAEKGVYPKPNVLVQLAHGFHAAMTARRPMTGFAKAFDMVAQPGRPPRAVRRQAMAIAQMTRIELMRRADPALSIERAILALGLPVSASTAWRRWCEYRDRLAELSDDDLRRLVQKSQLCWQ